MDQGEVLLQEILQSPDDDAPRLVYADWLQEHGGDAAARARGELIHAQLELERCTKVQRPALTAQIKQLLSRHGRKWTAELRKTKVGSRWTYRRGFLDSGTISAAKFVKVAEQMFELAPTLRSFRFPEASNELVRLAEHPYLARVTEADLHEMCSCGYCRIETELPVLFGSPNAANLRVLKLADCRMENDNAKLLAESPHLGRLTTLDVSANRLGPEGAAALSDSKLVSLTRLSIAYNGIGPEGATALAATRSRLTRLDLRSNAIGSRGAAALATSPNLESIEELDVRGNRIDSKTANQLRARFGTRVKI